MLTQEEYVQRVLELKRQGWSLTEIAREVGYHPATVAKWLKQGDRETATRATEHGSERLIALCSGPPLRLDTDVWAPLAGM